MLVLVSLVLIYQNTPMSSFSFWHDRQQNSTESETAGSSSGNETTSPVSESSGIPETTPDPVTRIELIGVGDIILHDALISGGKTGSENEEYDFTPAFQYIKKIIGEADLAMLNFEGTLAGPPYTGFPLFSAPDEIADALLDTGFEVAFTANNHILDKGVAGLLRTTEVLREKGFSVVGTNLAGEAGKLSIIDVKGIKVGLMAYTFETIGTEGDQGLVRGLNGVPMPEEAIPLLDSFNPYRKDVFTQDLAAILEHVNTLRKAGAEVVCLSLHWGEEYQTVPGSYQKQMARDLADAGVDIIFGHHPHVLQPIEIIQSEATGKATAVFYSTGNLLANMTYSTHGTEGKAQDAIIARVTIVRDENGLHLEKVEYTPTYINRVPKGQEWQHLVVPAAQAIEDPDAYQVSYSAVKDSLERIEKILLIEQETVIPVRQALAD